MTFQEFLDNPNITSIDFNDGSCEYGYSNDNSNDNEVTLFQISGNYKGEYHTLRFVQSIDGFIKVYLNDGITGFFIKARNFSRILKIKDFSLIVKYFISCLIKDDEILHAKHNDWLANQISDTASTSSTHPHLSTLERGGSSQHRLTCLGGAGKFNIYGLNEKQTATTHTRATQKNSSKSYAKNIALVDFSYSFLSRYYSARTIDLEKLGGGQMRNR